MRFLRTLRLALLCCTALAAPALGIPVLATESPRPEGSATAPGDLPAQGQPKAALPFPGLSPPKPPEAAASEGSKAPASPAPAQAPSAQAPTTQVSGPVRIPAPVRISQDPRPTLDPGSFINTARAAEAYLRIAEAGGWPMLPPGASLKAGDKGPLVEALKQHLAVTGDLAAEDRPEAVFNGALAVAVKRFQGRHGLPQTGSVGPKTLTALNVPATVRQRQLAASVQRLVGSAFPFGERYVVVNIPSATVEAIENGQVVHRYVAVAGKKDRASPILETRITNVNFNPTWTVPVSLIRKDIIPHMRRDPAYLAKMRIRVLDGKGQEVDPAKIDWSTEKAVNFTLRQDPGVGNSLGQIRIDMPNKQAVYMHDTPTKRLFAQDARFHSSGCVRVAEVNDFVQWLLAGTVGPGGGPWGRAEIEAAVADGRRQDVKLAKAVPVAWVYLTGYATTDGTVHFRDDVYGLDKDAPEPAGRPVASAPAPQVRTF